MKAGPGCDVISALWTGHKKCCALGTDRRYSEANLSVKLHVFVSMSEWQAQTPWVFLWLQRREHWYVRYIE
jgi:hypothetical protein